MGISRFAWNAMKIRSLADPLANLANRNQMSVASVPAYYSSHSSLMLSNVTRSSSSKHLAQVATALKLLRSDSRGISSTPHYQYPLAEAIEDDSYMESSVDRLPGLEATKPGEKPRVVVIGTGWGGCRFLKDLDTNIYDVVCISHRNHMVFTPLLASTCVGTLEFRSVAEPVSRIQPALAQAPKSYFYLASCTELTQRSMKSIVRLFQVVYLQNHIALKFHMTSWL